MVVLGANSSASVRHPGESPPSLKLSFAEASESPRSLSKGGFGGPTEALAKAGRGPGVRARLTKRMQRQDDLNATIRVDVPV